MLKFVRNVTQCVEDLHCNGFGSFRIKCRRRFRCGEWAEGGNENERVRRRRSQAGKRQVRWDVPLSGKIIPTGEIYSRIRLI